MVAVLDGAEVGSCVEGRAACSEVESESVCTWNPYFVSMSLDSAGSLDLMNRRLRFNVPTNVCAFICSLDYASCSSVHVFQQVRLRGSYSLYH
jgi:hypothetical protein